MAVTKRTVRIVIATGAALGALYFFWVVRKGLYPFILALLLAYLMNPAVCYLELKGLRRFWGIVLVYLFLFSFIFIVGSQIFPMLIRELDKLAEELPTITSKGEYFLQSVQQQQQAYYLPNSLRLAVDEAILSFEAQMQGLVSDMVATLVGLIKHLVGLAISPILAFYLLHDWYNIKEELMKIIPARWRHEIVLALKDVDKVLNGVIRGQLIIALIVGILVSIGLFLLNVKFALLIGITAGIFDIIPYFGAVIGATPAILMALLDSPWLAVKVIIMFFIIHQLEGTIIGPKILGESVGLHPLTVIFFLFIGGEIAGITGMLLGVPAAALVKVFVRHMVKALV